ncbi:virulence-related outer membrane protein [Xenorhabdus vietnamensis]|uniref:Virulence-related outer membrane protein n=1 Tax=Xenorhabdus vietnamensis TaxID=351656 RepID=A0A1Y2S9L8_9GAMM|nr:Ail/Lom family outer membrane beta-barrel protein [Xenorhabdus vietnamensis]OTA14859.1 virulence-related outer membrane protein [Xenorhabdus vietnamensis]
MKNAITVSTLAVGLLFCSFSQAESQAISLGYAHVKLQENKALKGAILNYHYELSNEWGILSSFTFAKGDRKETEEDCKVKFKYYSSMIGPTYRINNYLNIYGQAGIAPFKAKFSEDEGYNIIEQGKLTSDLVKKF